MHELELLNSLRPTWLNRASVTLLKGSAFREDIRSQLERFYGLLEQAVETGDSAWLDAILVEWESAHTQTDLEDNASTLTSFIAGIIQLTYAAASEGLSESDALSLIGALLPHLTYAIQKASGLESQARVNYISSQLEKAQQTLDRLDRSKSDFIAVAAHELKTPLTLVDGYASMLRESLERKSSDPVETILINGIHNGTQRLQTIINDMIDVSLIDNSLLSLNFQPTWLNRLFSILWDEVRQTVKDRNQKLEVKPFSGSDEMTFADPERLLQVFRNILANSIKFTPDNGTITIDGRKLPGFVEVTFSDTGIGIDPDDAMIIFEKFSSPQTANTLLHSSGKTKFKGGGPGLGLHIARGIIESHGGAIWVESPGYDENACPGSIFHVLIPLRTEPPDAAMARLFAPLTQLQQEPEKTNDPIN